MPQIHQYVCGHGFQSKDLWFLNRRDDNENEGGLTPKGCILQKDNLHQEVYLISQNYDFLCIYFIKQCL